MRLPMIFFALTPKSGHLAGVGGKPSGTMRAMMRSRSRSSTVFPALSQVLRRRVSRSWRMFIECITQRATLCGILSSRFVHADKTRIVEFGRYADHNRRNRGSGKPETFNFLGFTHSCGKTRKGHFTVLRQTMRQRWQAKLRALKEELRRRLHTPFGNRERTCARSCWGTSAITGSL